MNPSDDSYTDMSDDDLTDEQIEQLLTGGPTPEGYDELSATLASLRDANAAQPAVPVSGQLGEFVSGPAPSGYLTDITVEPRVAVAPPAPSRKSSMLTALAASTTAKLALAGGLAVAGVTGAHALGVVDVPLLPNDGAPAELVVADSSGPPANDEQPSAIGEPEDNESAEAPEQSEATDVPISDVTVGEGRIEASIGDTSIAIRIENVDGELAIKIDVEGVSAACEAAIESLESLNSPEALERAGEDVAESCKGEIELPFLSLDKLDVDLDGLFDDKELGRLFGLGDDFDSDRLKQLFEDFEPGFYFDGLGEFDQSELDKFFEQFDGTGFGLGEFDPEQLDEFFKDFDPERFGQFFEEFDPSQLGPLFEGFDSAQFDTFLDEFDPQLFDQFLEDFDPTKLEEFLESLGGLGSPGGS